MINNNKEILLFLKEAKERGILKGQSDEILEKIEDIEKTPELEILICKLVQALKIEYFNLGSICKEIEKGE